MTQLDREAVNDASLPLREQQKRTLNNGVISPHQTDLGDSRETEMLSYGGAGATLTVPFQPDKLCMLPEGGRIYHAGLDRLDGVGLVKSSLAIELSRFFVYEEGATSESCPPVGFRWRGKTWTLDGSTIQTLRNLKTGNHD